MSKIASTPRQPAKHQNKLGETKTVIHANDKSTSGNDASGPTLMTIRGVARFLGCSIANVYALIDAGELPVISIGKLRGYRIDRRDLDEFLLRRKTTKAVAIVKLPRPKLKHIRLP